MVPAEDAEFAGGGADSGKCGIELGGAFSLDINEELIFPRMPVDGAALDFEKVHAVLCERLEGSEERAGAMSEAHSDGNFSGIRCSPGSSLMFWEQEHKARKVFGVVLNGFGENDGAVMLSGAAASDSGARFISPSKHLADAAGGIFRGDALEMRVGEKELLALRKCHRMRGDRPDVVQGGTRRRNEVMFDRKDGFRDDGERTFEQQVVNTHHRASERVFHGNEKGIGRAFGNGPERGIKRGTRDCGNRFAEKLNGGGFAEGAGLALKGYARGFVSRWIHRQALSCNKGRKTRSGE
jgi:hypothetical protein